MNNNRYIGNALFTFILIIGLIAISRFTSFKPFLGSIESRAVSTITVSGTAEEDISNQIATFSVGMDSIESTKEEALNKVNQAMNDVIAKVKEFGIDDQDIQTRNADVYQETEYVGGETSTLIYPVGDAQKGDWRGNNSLTIKLRDVSKAEELLSILNNSNANYVTGPDYSVENDDINTNALLNKAVVNAREKAASIAQANGQKVGKILSVSENGTNSVYPMYELAIPMAGGGSSKSVTDANLEPGSTTTSKAVTVTFELN